MSILSSIGGALSGAYNTVKNTVTNAVSSLGNVLSSVRGSNQSANALQATLTPQGSQYIAQKYAPPSTNVYATLADGTGKSTPIPGGNPLVNIQQSNGQMTPVGATSFKSGSTPVSSTPVSSGGASGSWGASNYSSPSYSTNYSSLAAATLSPSSSSSSAPVSTTISSGTLGSGTPSVVMPSTPTPSNYTSTATSGNIKVGANPATGLLGNPHDAAGYDPTNDPNSTAYNSSSDSKKALDEYIASLKPPASEADAYAKALQQSGLEQARIQKNNTQNAINAVTTKMNTDLLQLRSTAAQEGVTEAVYGGQQAEVSREATIKLLPLQAQLAVDQGNLELAQENTTTLFKIYADDAKNSADFYNKQAEKIYDFATAEEKKKLDEKVWQKNFNAETVKADAKDQSDLAVELLKSGSQAGYRALAALRLPTNVNSPTFAEDYQNYKKDLGEIVSQYGGNIGLLDRETKQAQLNKINADAAAAAASDSAVTPNVLQGMLNVYKSTGVLPSFGLSAKSPLRAQFYAALGADGGIVTEANTNKAVRAGLNTSYKTQQNLLSANQTAIGTLDQQLDLVKQYSDQVNRTNSPLVNKYLIGVKTGVFGDPETTALNNIVKTASYEFAKILSGSAASISGVTVTSAADAESMLNSAMSKGQFSKVLDLMRQESNFRLKSQTETLKQIENDLNNVGSLSQDAKDVQSGKIPAVDTQAPANTTLMTGPDGTFHVPNAQIEIFKKNGYK